MPKVKKAEIMEALDLVQDPELHRSVIELEMVRGVDISKGGDVQVKIALTTSGCPLKAEFDDRIRDALGEIQGVAGVSVEFDVMSEAELKVLRSKLGGGAQTQGQESGQAGKEARTIPFADPDSKTRVMLISSGKGGVGKSSVSVNLAVTLAALGKSVALVDADVWGFSVPRMLGISRPPVVIDNMLLPPEAYGVRCISTGFFAQEGQPVIWRGPMLHKALEQFLADVFWDEPDYLLVDLPPGTGDVSISLSQFLPRSEVYIVTTPQLVAQKVAERAGAMAAKVNLEVRGVIENMSWFAGDDGKRYEIFGSGGGQQLAEHLEVPLLAQVPLVDALRQGGDEGMPIAASDPNGEAGAVFAKLAQIIDVDLAPTRIYSSQLKVN